jgi:hypothetical protein
MRDVLACDISTESAGLLRIESGIVLSITPVTSNAIVLLDELLKSREKERGGTPLPADEAFELFSFEQALKDSELSPEEIAEGQVGGGEDGGIDGIFTFLNGNLIAADSEVLEEGFDVTTVPREPELLLVVVQAKQTPSFAETPFEKLQTTFSEILELAKTEEELLELFSSSLVEHAEVFRTAWHRLSPRHPSIAVRVIYASKGDTTEINDKVHARARRIEAHVTKTIPKAAVEVEFLGARELVDLAGREKSYTLALSYRENATDDNSHVALVDLDDYFSFITDDAGALRRYIFDWNVRDYEGEVEVNREIATGLRDPDSPEFWWLNNGVTVICSQASTRGRTFTLDDVQIVNGLQTSVTIFEHLRAAQDDDPARKRSVLVRIIVTDNHDTRDRVIRATNRQTAVTQASLRATDQIQRDIERYFLSQEWFYERRKNYYRNQGRTPGRIISIPYLAQAIMAIGLSEPSNSRARPSSLLKSETDYGRIFDPKLDFGVYLWAARTQRRVDDFLRTDEAATTASERTNLRFHVSMLAVANAHGAKVYNPSQLKPLVDTEFSDEDLIAALVKVRASVATTQAETSATLDKIAKGSAFTDALLAAAFPS